MLKIAAVAVIAAMCAVVVKKHVRELGLALSLLAGVVILSFTLSAAGRVGQVLSRFTELAGLSPTVLLPVVKTAGIAAVTHISAQVCKDAGEGGIAAFTETAGAVAAAVAAVPLLEALIDVMKSLI